MNWTDYEKKLDNVLKAEDFEEDFLLDQCCQDI